MKKRLIIAFWLIVLSAVLVACANRGYADDVVLDTGSSEIYSTDEISAAMDAVIRKFADFEGCTLTKLWYDEGFSNPRTKDYESGTAIVLLCEFDVDSSGGDGSFNPNSTYSNWQWILTRESDSADWQVVNWGF